VIEHFLDLFRHDKRLKARASPAIMVSFKSAWVCHHCKERVAAGEEHDCWTTTEAALTEDLPEDLREAWERLRETAADFGDQRVYASGRCIMFSRTACYFFVRPKRSFLEVCFFLGRTVKAPQIRRTAPASRRKIAHIVRVTHRDEIEPPMTDWLREAYQASERLSGNAAARSRTRARKAH
jgi:Domain of unknown function (DUF5655)